MRDPGSATPAAPDRFAAGPAGRAGDPARAEPLRCGKPLQPARGSDGPGRPTTPRPSPVPPATSGPGGHRRPATTGP
ncbi:hypothetical protein GCM10010421_34840 [Streptomyces glaucus]|uniref:Uncharacterized protein n=1 Tax=Streptomyces glaucus TaxID=284029 RepID=A0ABP5WZT7_9ACTN